MKYVMFGTTTGRKFAVIFPDHMVHAQVAQFIGVLSLRAHKEQAYPVSAGFIGLGDDVTTTGESESLGLKSDKVDALRIMIGESVSSMPDAMLQPLWQKVEDAKKPSDAMREILQRWRDGYAFNEDSAEDVALLEQVDAE